MKNIVIFLIIIGLVLGGIYIGTKKNKTIVTTTEKQKKLNKLNNINKKLDYFNDNYINRYISYKEKNNNLSLTDVVTRVNIGLDQEYYTNTKVSPYPNNDYILVNKYIKMGDNYIPDNLEDLSLNYSRSGMKLVSSAKDAFEELVKNAKKDGYTIKVTSSYRSYDYQVNLYNNYVKQDGVEAADTYSARPGFSEHQTGLVVDVSDGIVDFNNFEDSKSFDWMTDNAYKYGFILRYPKDKTNITGYTYESWHYRYVGKEIANYIKKHNITFDEYYVKFIEGKK